MDIASDAGAALAMRAGMNSQQISLGAIKRQAQADSEVVTMAMESGKGAAKATSNDPNLGNSVDLKA